MSLLDGIQVDNAVAGEKDIIGGGGVLDSNIYEMVIDVAYLEKSKGGALAIVVRAKTDTGVNYTEKLWARSGDAKGNKTTYTDAKQQEQYLPGFLTARALCMLAGEVDITGVTTDLKAVGIYNPELKKEVPTEVEVITDLTGKTFYGAVLRETVNKSAQQADGSYADTAETRDQNVLDKIFRSPDRFTVPELTAGSDEPKFFDQWLEKNAGVTRDRVKAVSGSPAASGGAATAGAVAKPAKSLFAKAE